MRFLSLYIVFVSFSLALLLSGGVQGIPVSVSNRHTPPRHAELHRRSEDITNTVLGLLASLLGALGIPLAALQPVETVVDHAQNLTTGLLPALPGLPIPRGAVEAVSIGSSYSSSSTVQANSTASPSNVSASPSPSVVDQQAEVHPGRGRHIHHRDTISASAPLSSGVVHASSTSASGLVRPSSASAPGKPALAVLPTLPVSLPIPIPTAPVALPIPSIPLPLPPLPVSAPIPTPSLPVSPPIAVPVLAASGMPMSFGTIKGKRTHHR
ncbi:hypothetical protein CY34DRAFT_447065 [Suillus luteus UH-Slu-Lm8-n1]|uniref:Uncharacterized protein n=1 Tax=Suillus luteus UH-Slu-Lm8-n1 TaxID=930992 RepID=A0A0D0AHK4_9AGAM|nr:hypothetical protein CY34DRAFT_447065 [Suillus luteus UH-Slu-Lm8-n1]